MKASLSLVLLALLALLLAGAQVSVEAVTCAPTQLSPCASAITTNAPPSALCCMRLRQQKPCLCGYLRNPSLRRFVSSPNARKVGNLCRVPYPRC